MIPDSSFPRGVGQPDQPRSGVGQPGEGTCTQPMTRTPLPEADRRSGAGRATYTFLKAMSDEELRDLAHLPIHEWEPERCHKCEALIEWPAVLCRYCESAGER